MNFNPDQFLHLLVFLKNAAFADGSENEKKSGIEK